MTPPDDQLLAPGTRCPRCDYEIGVPDSTACSECGLAAPEIVSINAARIQCGSQLAGAFAWNACLSSGGILFMGIVLTALASGGFRTAIILFGGLWAGSLVLGFASTFIAPARERKCWRLLWFRSHLFIVAPLALFPINIAIGRALGSDLHLALLIPNVAIFLICHVNAWRIRRSGRRRLLLASTLAALLLTAVQLLAVLLLGLLQFMSFGMNYFELPGQS